MGNCATIFMGQAFIRALLRSTSAFTTKTLLLFFEKKKKRSDADDRHPESGKHPSTQLAHNNPVKAARKKNGKKRQNSGALSHASLKATNRSLLRCHVPEHCPNDWHFRWATSGHLKTMRDLSRTWPSSFLFPFPFFAQLSLIVIVYV